MKYFKRINSIPIIILILLLLPFFLFQISIKNTNFQENIQTHEVPLIKTKDLVYLKPSSDHSDYMYFKDIVIDHEQVEGISNLNDFPLLIDILDSDLKSYAQTDGHDIAFFSGLTQLDHEIENYNPYYSSEYARLVVWVRIPSLSCYIDTIIRMYFGNSSLTSQENVGSVWDSDFEGIWHLSENPAGTIFDSTLNDNDGSSEGTMTENSKVIGKIGNGLDFDGANDYISIGDINHSSDFITVSFWMAADVVKNMIPIDKFPFALIGEYGWSIRLNSNTSIDFCSGNSGVFGNDHTVASNVYLANSWTYLTCTLSTTEACIFRNGIKIVSSNILNHDFNDNNVSLRFGIPSQEYTNYRFDGVLDEIRISNIVRSDEWIGTEYKNQNDPTNFYSIGPLEGPGLNPPDVIITSPINSSIHDPPSLTIRATIIDDETFVSDATATLDNGTTQNVISMSQLNSTTWECTWDFSSSSFLAQDYTITITAHDSEGNFNNTESVMVKIQKDLIAPNIIFLSPYDGTFVGEPFTIMATIIDSAGNDPGDGDVFATIKYGGNSLFNLEMERIGGTNDWTAEWSNITLPDYQLGDYTIDITAIDTSFYRNEQTIGSRTITLIDTHAPIVMINSMYSGPYGQEQTHEEIIINATIKDDKSAITEVKAMISGLETFNITMHLKEGIWTCIWDNVTECANGTYTITIWAKDKWNNINDTQSIIVIIENLPPSQSPDPPALNKDVLIILLISIPIIFVHLNQMVYVVLL